MDYDLYDDEQLVNGILNNDRPLTEYFFQKKCSKLFSYILLNVFDGNIDKRELVSELYLFMANNDLLNISSGIVENSDNLDFQNINIWIQK